MTRGYWECVKCNFTKRTHITFFTKKCPNCGAEYELLAHAINYHVSHVMPIYKLKTEDYSKFRTNGYSVFARGEGPIIMECIDKQFYKFLKKKNSKNLKLVKKF
jgi:hypothetical protein